ncbi:MAG TPA: Uma2 family endonuclease [Thermoanaerobaculia bacterium]|nr:Uma2 family endonuclease [Thermoanaerobaculia bacterium]
MSTRSAVAKAPEFEPSTIEEFLAWEDDRWAEWVDGKVIRMAPVTLGHQEIVNFLLTLLRLYIEEHDLGIVSTTAPYAMHLPARQRVREPDLLFVSKQRMDRLKDLYLDGAADLVVEVVSPDSRRRDRVEKVVDYEAEGVREYWVIDPRRRQVELRRLGADGRFRLIEPVEGIFTSESVPGFRLRIDWLWRQPPPKILDAARELGLV